MTRSRQARLSVIIGCITLILALIGTRVHDPLIDAQEARIQDLAYYTGLTDYFWGQEAGPLYSLEYRKRAMSFLLGREMDRPMPALWSPTFPVLLAPFRIGYPQHIERIHLVWVALSSLFFLAWAMKRRELKGVALLSTALISPLGISALVLGQPSILVAGCLGLLLFERNVSRAALLYFLSSFKPTFLIPATILLLARRQWRELFLGGALVMAAAIGVAWWSGTFLFDSYLGALGLFREQRISEPFSNDPALMTNILVALTPLLGWEVSLKISLALFCAALLGALWIARTDAPRATILAMSSVLLFSPYLGWYEDFLIFPLFGFLMERPTLSKREQQGAVVLLACVLFLLFRPIFISELGRVLIVLAKGVILGGLFLLQRPVLQGHSSAQQTGS